MSYNDYDGTLFRRDEAARFIDSIPVESLSWVKHITIHNTDAPNMAQEDATPDRNRDGTGEDDRMRNAKVGYAKWEGRGPNFWSFNSGMIGLGTVLPKQGVHSPSWNHTSIGIEMVADFDPGKDDPYSGGGLVIVDTTAWLTAKLLLKRGLPATSDTIRLHKEDKKTTHNCPGNAFKKDDFVHRVQQYMSAEGMTKPVSTPAEVAVWVNTPGDKLNLRDAPKGNLKGSIPHSYPVTIISNNGEEWVRIQTPAKVIGWVNATYLSTVKPPKVVVGPIVEDNPSIAMKTLAGIQWPKHWAAGAIAQAQREAYPALRPHAEGDWMKDGKAVPRNTPGAHPTAFTIWQLRNERWADYKMWANERAKPWDDLVTQVLWCPHELKKYNMLPWRWLQKAENVEQACAAMVWFERPKGYISSKAKAAQTWAEVFAVSEKCDGWKERLAFAHALMDKP